MSESEEDVKSGKARTKQPRANVAIVMQNDILTDLLSTLEEIQKSKDIPKVLLKSYQNSATADYENSNKYNKAILGSTKLTDDAIKAYSDAKTHKRIKDTYWRIFAEITDRLGTDDDKPTTTKESKGSQKCEIRLEPLGLPSFSGKYDEWLPFINLFISVVDKKDSLDPVQKLQYLLQYCTGEAHKQIKNLTLNNENYDKAMEILDDQYNHPRKIADTYMKTLLGCKAITDENSNDLRKFISNVKDCLFSLESLGLPTESWGYILLYILQSKIPSVTFIKWGEYLGASRDIPKFETFIEFLESRFRTLEMVEGPSKDVKKPQKALHTQTVSHSKPKTNQRMKPQHQQTQQGASSSGSFRNKKPFNQKSNVQCAICKQSHATAQCNQFRNNTAAVRRQLAQQHKLCFNCLGSSHTLDVCYSTRTCIYCKKQHHSLLHIHEETGPNTRQTTQSQPGPHPQQQQQTVQQSNSFYASSDSQAVRILGTALIRIVNSSGYSITVRALLDSGADDNYIINSAVQNAGLKKYSAVAAITGLNDVTVGSTDHKVNFQIQSLDGSFQLDSSASVVETITSKMPAQYVDPENFGSLNNLPLADPNFNHPGKIQILLGVGFIVRIRKPGLKRFRDLIAEQTLLGWVVMGQCSTDSTQTFLTRSFVFLTKCVNNEDLSKQIQKFFEIEEFSENIPQKPEDVLCERKFVESVKQGIDGKLTVELPFVEDSCPLMGASRHIAMRRFLNLEKKLDNNPTLKEEYSKTFTDYLKEGHMIPVTAPAQPGYEYFLPHHAVIKESSSTTKVRVVFDGSCKTTDSTSLNDRLLTGPKLQTDIRDIFFNWRQYKYALTADIAKMYRMFWIAEEHRNYQKVLWRFSKDQPVSEFCLATVTFGTSSAPFQAIRALHYIAERESPNYPLVSKALLKEFYVDDFISGAHSIQEAVKKQEELRKVLCQYGLNIRKWSSNTEDALRGINSDLKETLTELSFEEEEFRKTLGVFWAPKGDFFSFSTAQFNNDKQTLTKRTILSLIARLYDPMGWVGPCTLHAKIIMQRIWEQQLGWDDEVCGTIKADFEEFLQDLHQLTKIKLPRWIKILDDDTPITLYGFSDASLKAYGSVLYIKNPDVTDSNKLLLLTSRTRVKPLKHVTLARLELNAAVMLAEMVKWAKKLLEPRKVKVLVFSDSQIVLSWLRSHPSRWKMYVAGRTTKILESTTSEEWSYVNTKHNPADFASRGLMPSDLISNKLWWNGPSLEDLENDASHPNLTKEESETIQNEMKEVKPVLHTKSSPNTILTLLGKYSSHGKMCGIMELVTGFLKRIFLKLVNRFPSKKEFYTPLIQRFSNGEHMVLRQIQRAHFAAEIKALESRQPLPGKSKILSQNPFIDGFGMLRVGGRLQNSYVSYNQKHPIILPSHSQVTTNLIHLAHHATLHGTNSLTASYLRFKFHILRCADRIKILLRSCPKCIRLAKERHEQLMGSLPTNRVNPHRPFLCTGVDYAGPFTVKAYKGRCNKFLKSYVALFVCFTTKAIHLELVSELTATAFYAAFRRFVSRRGNCQTLHSDCGTNFVKGNKLMMEEVYKAEKTWKSELAIDFQAMGTKWEFNPPGAPHFGGLWEAGVKSMKTHLTKTLGNTILTSEEFNTLLIQIEGILNSRPLCPLNSDSTDCLALTPAHFLIGECIVSPPDRAYDLESKHPLDRWQFIQKMKQMFWVSWKREYLHRLNVRPKWKSPGIEYKIDDLVLLTDENTPATYWPMAKIVDTHPGRDGVTRVVTLKTSKGQFFKRPTAKIRLLAFNPEDFSLNTPDQTFTDQNSERN